MHGSVFVCVHVGLWAGKGVAEKNVGEAFSTYLTQLYLMESNWSPGLTKVLIFVHIRV